MTWMQNYNPLGNLGLSALVAAVPLFILLYMLGIRRAKGHHAAFFGTLSAVLLAILVWDMPVQLAAMATVNGMLFGLFPVVWIIITAIWVYNMTVESGEFEIIKNSLACITDDRRLQALFIAFAFGSFIEGTAAPSWAGWASSSPAPTPPPMPCSAPCKRLPPSKSGWTPVSWWRPTPASGSPGK